MKQGFRVMDSDLHTMEPDGLWERYLDEPFKTYAPQLRPRAPTNRRTSRSISVGDLEHRRDVQAAARRGGRRGPAAPRVRPASPLRRGDRARVRRGVARAGDGHRGDRRRRALRHARPAGADARRAGAARWRPRWRAPTTTGRATTARSIAPSGSSSPPRWRFTTRRCAVAEARRAVRELGAVAVIGNPNPINGRHVHDPEFEPLWTAIEELGVPVGFHPTGHVVAPRRHRAPLPRSPQRARDRRRRGATRWSSCSPSRSLAAGGVLERHPRLRCAFLEGTCGWLPWWLWRLDEAWEKFGPGSEVQIRCLPSEYFFRQCYVATDADEKVLAPGGGGDGRRQHRRLDGLSALRRALPGRDQRVRRAGWRGPEDQGEDPVGQLRQAVSAGGGVSARAARTSAISNGTPRRSWCAHHRREDDSWTS